MTIYYRDIDATFEDAYQQALTLVESMRSIHPASLLDHLKPIKAQVHLTYDEGTGELKSILLIPITGDSTWPG